ncbi:MAG: DUF4056 domain-containing protein [Psychromonas sp.]
MSKHALIMLLLLLTSACSNNEWQFSAKPSEKAVASALDNQPDFAVVSEFSVEDFPLAKLPEAVRPCCAFGNAQKVKIGSVQIPFFRYANTLSADDIGPHSYEAGTFSFTKSNPNGSRGTENNGLIYTLRGGFIDLAHVRDTADNAIALFYRIQPQLGQPITIELPKEIGTRFIHIKAFDVSHLDNRQQWELAATMAVRLAYFMAEAHEVAQWHGYRSWVPWSEEVSAYSPEDLYSNMLGAKIALAILNNNLAMTRELYNQHMSTWLSASINWLEPVSRQQTNALFDITDGIWWDSEQAMPSKFMLLKRHYLLGDKQSPYLVPEHLAEQHALWKQVKPLYQNPAKAHHLSLSSTLHGIDIEDISELVLHIGEKYQESFEHIPQPLWHDGLGHKNFRAVSEYNQQQDILELKQFRRDKKSQ